MKNELLKVIKSLQGKVLAIGLEEVYAEAISKNGNIVECNLLEGYNRSREKGQKRNKGKKIKIKKLKKYFKKKSIETILCQEETITKYRNSFIRNSVYVNKGKTYIYGVLEDYEEWVKKYKRYEVDIEVKTYSEKKIIIIDNSHSKPKVIKEWYYRIYDAVEAFIIVVGDVLMG